MAALRTRQTREGGRAKMWERRRGRRKARKGRGNMPEEPCGVTVGTEGGPVTSDSDFHGLAPAPRNLSCPLPVSWLSHPHYCLSVGSCSPLPRLPTAGDCPAAPSGHVQLPCLHDGFGRGRAGPGLQEKSEAQRTGWGRPGWGEDRLWRPRSSLHPGVLPRP